MALSAQFLAVLEMYEQTGAQTLGLLKSNPARIPAETCEHLVQAQMCQLKCSAIPLVTILGGIALV